MDRLVWTLTTTTEIPIEELTTLTDRNGKPVDPKSLAPALLAEELSAGRIKFGLDHKYVKFVTGSQQNFDTTPEPTVLEYFQQLDRRMHLYPKSLVKQEENLLACEVIIQRLVDLGVYPPPTKAMLDNEYTYLTMIENYGVFWHMYADPIECPYCHSDLRSPEGPPFSRLISIYSQVLDMSVAYQCPDCGDYFPIPDREDYFQDWVASRKE